MLYVIYKRYNRNDRYNRYVISVRYVRSIRFVRFLHSNVSQSESSHVFDEIANFTNLCRSQDSVIRIT